MNPHEFKNTQDTLREREKEKKPVTIVVIIVTNIAGNEKQKATFTKKKSPTVIGINRTLNLNYSLTIIKKNKKCTVCRGSAERFCGNTIDNVALAERGTEGM